MLFGSAAEAQNPAKPAGIPVTQVVRVYDAVVVYPAGPWTRAVTDPKQMMSAAQRFPTQHGSTYVLEEISKNETLQNWKQMLKVTGLLSTSVPQLSMKQALSAHTAGYANACEKGNAAQQVLREEQTVLVFVVLCGNAINGPKAVGYGDGVGEIAVGKLFKLKNTLVAVQFSWRGAKFNAANQASFIVPVAKVLETSRWIDASSSVQPAQP